MVHLAGGHLADPANETLEAQHPLQRVAAGPIVRIVGIYASARGWLEIAFAQRATAERIIERHRHDLYSGGWAFPSAPFS